VRKMIDAAYHRTLDLLTLRKAEVEKLAKELLDKEVLHKSDVELLIGRRPYEEEKVVTFDVEETPATPAAEDNVAPAAETTATAEVSESLPTAPIA